MSKKQNDAENGEAQALLELPVQLTAPSLQPLSVADAVVADEDRQAAQLPAQILVSAFKPFLSALQEKDTDPSAWTPPEQKRLENDRIAVYARAEAVGKEMSRLIPPGVPVINISRWQARSSTLDIGPRWHWAITWRFTGYSPREVDLFSADHNVVAGLKMAAEQRAGFVSHSIYG